MKREDKEKKQAYEVLLFNYYLLTAYTIAPSTAQGHLRALHKSKLYKSHTS